MSELQRLDFANKKSAFLQPTYLKGLADALGCAGDVYVDSDDKFAIALFERPDYPGKTLPPFTPFSQIWLRDDKFEALDLSGLGKYLDSEKGRHHLHLYPRLRARTDLEGWDQKDFQTYLIDLSGSDWRSHYSTSVKRLLKKTSGHYTISEGEKFLDDICDLVVSSYERGGRRAPLDIGGIRTLAGQVVRSGGASCHAIFDANEKAVKAGVVVLKSNEESFYWLAGGEKGPWMTVLLDQIFEGLANQGITRFDFMGANTPRIAEFKRRFGGDLTRYQGFEKLVGIKARLRDQISNLKGHVR